MMLFKTAYLLSLCFSVHGLVEINIKQKKNGISIPPASDVVCMARFIVHNSDWCSVAYNSQDDLTIGLPLTRIYSISDGLIENSTGTVYFMVSPKDLTVQDLLKKSNCSAIMSLVQGEYCDEKKYDPQDPRCAQVILSGNFISIPKKSEEFEIAKNVLWKRHPVMKFWYYAVPGHKWFFAKLTLQRIAVVDKFGGRQFPAVSDYFHKNCTAYLTQNKFDYNQISTA